MRQSKSLRGISLWPSFRLINPHKDISSGSLLEGENGDWPIPSIRVIGMIIRSSISRCVCSHCRSSHIENSLHLVYWCVDTRSNFLFVLIKFKDLLLMALRESTLMVNFFVEKISKTDSRYLADWKNNCKYWHGRYEPHKQGCNWKSRKSSENHLSIQASIHCDIRLDSAMTLIAARCCLLSILFSNNQ